ncbi:MAG: MGMT family protein [Nanoarchaeota archaeon]
MAKESQFFNQAWKVCAKIPRGKVTTYKEIANALNTNAYRAIGQAMHNNPYAPRVPCHRVVSSGGSLGGFAHPLKRKIELLKKEGVEVKNGKIVDFEKRLFRFK